LVVPNSGSYSRAAAPARISQQAVIFRVQQDDIADLAFQRFQRKARAMLAPYLAIELPELIAILGEDHRVNPWCILQYRHCKRSEAISCNGTNRWEIASSLRSRNDGQNINRSSNTVSVVFGAVFAQIHDRHSGHLGLRASRCNARAGSANDWASCLNSSGDEFEQFFSTSSGVLPGARPMRLASGRCACRQRWSVHRSGVENDIGGLAATPGNASSAGRSRGTLPPCLFFEDCTGRP